MNKIECFFDGACAPQNPGGHMGFGGMIIENDELIHEFSGYRQAEVSNSCNVAEYLGLYGVLLYLNYYAGPTSKITIYGDSKLVINQMSGRWGINSGAYSWMAQTCQLALNDLPYIKFRHISRSFNDYADSLSKEVMRQRMSKKTEDVFADLLNSSYFVCAIDGVGFEKNDFFRVVDELAEIVWRGHLAISVDLFIRAVQPVRTRASFFADLKKRMYRMADAHQISDKEIEELILMSIRDEKPKKSTFWSNLPDSLVEYPRYRKIFGDEVDKFGGMPEKDYVRIWETFEINNQQYFPNSK